MKAVILISTLLLTAIRLSAEPATPFRPEFIAIHSREPLTIAPVKWSKPIYNLVGWKRADGTMEDDIFKAADVIALTHPSIKQRG